MVKALPCLLHAFRGWLSPTVLIRARFKGRQDQRTGSGTLTQLMLLPASHIEIMLHDLPGFVSSSGALPATAK